MVEGRDTRFNDEVIALACERYDAAKDQCSISDDDADNGHAIIDHLGWGLFGLWELSELITQQAMDHTTEFRGDPVGRAFNAASMAFIQGLLLGAICADVTYEVAAGLTELSG